MKQSVRHILASTAALIAALSVVLGFTAPAEAESRSTCTSPTISGSVMPGSDFDGGYALTFKAQGYSSTTCASNYRWTLTLDSQSTGPVSVSSSTTFQYRGQLGVNIPFASRTFAAPSGHGLMSLTVRTQTNSFGFWWPVSSQSYFLDVPNDRFSTAALPDSSGATCSASGGPIVGAKGWC